MYIQARIDKLLPSVCMLFGRDSCLTEIMPKDVRRFINAELEKGLKTSTVANKLSILCAATERYLRDHDLPIRNPFYRPEIPRNKFDITPFRAIPRERLSGLRALCFLMDDDIRWLLAMLIDTGARLSEVSGAALSDLRIADDFPHLVIEERPWRRIKTRYSRRTVPLAGIALWAAIRVVATAKPGQVVAFPRYVINDRLRSASSPFKNWLKNRDVNCSVHGFRHTFLDRLRDIDCPVDVRRSLLGWSANSAEGRYGFGPSIQIKAKWVTAIVPEDFAAITNLRHLPGSAGNRDTGCANAQKLVRYLSAHGERTLPELLAAGLLGRKDLQNALRYGRKHKAIDIVEPQKTEPSYRYRYFVTGRELPKEPLRQPTRRPRALGCSLPSSFRPAHGPAQCFIEPIRLASDSWAPWARTRCRRGLIRKCVVSAIDALPSEGEGPSDRDCADAVVAAMEQGREYSREALREAANVTEQELLQGLKHLYTVRVIRCHWALVDDRRIRYITLTGRPMPKRRKHRPVAIARTRKIFVESDRFCDL